MIHDLKTATATLVFCATSLLMLGLVMLYSAGDVQKAGGTVFFKSQMVAALIGVGLCLCMSMIDHRLWKKCLWIIIPVALALLVWVLFQKKTNGARRWFYLPGGFAFQPSEYAKIALLMFLAWYGEKHRLLMPMFWKGVCRPALVPLLMIGLILVEPDVGTALLLLGLTALMLFLAGAKARYFLVPGIIAIIALSVFVRYNPVRSERIYAWLHPEETRLGVGRQAWESRVAFGAGGLTGRGLGNSRQKYSFISEHHTDFIFPIIGEELGLIASLSVVVLFALLVTAGFYIASRAPDLYGLLLGAGITLLIGGQAFANIAVVTGVVPNKGLPLPFISSGGSNLILMLGCVGLLLNIARVGRSEPLAEADDVPAATSLTPQMT